MEDKTVGNPVASKCPGAPKVQFKNIDPKTEQALKEFDAASKPGDRGYSVKNLSVENKSAAEIDHALAGPEGWKTHPQTGKQVSSDGQWTKTEIKVEKNPDGTPCTPYPMHFYENADGGVVRLKPQGMPDARFEHMKQPHGCKYVKKEAGGDTSFDNEAFKVNGGGAIPKVPAQIELPPGVNPGSPEAEAYIVANWKQPSHQPIKP